MRILALCLLLATPLLGGCRALILPAAEVITYPMGAKGKFEEAQKRYTIDIRFGLWDEALAFVEPEHRSRFSEEMTRMREIRFSEHRIESIDIDPDRTRATATVVFRGYWLSSPFEQETRVVQHWRRLMPSQDWYVTPDFANLLVPPTGG